MKPLDIKTQFSLKELTSWQIGGQADYYCEPEDINQIDLALKWAKTKNIPLSILGGGSNVLISDRGVEGLVLSLRKINFLKIENSQNELLLYCGAGLKKTELLKVFLNHSLSPALFLAGLPGDVGGGIVMNAGVSESLLPKEFGEIVHSFRVMTFDGGIKEFQGGEVTWSYRHSSGWGPGVIIDAKLRWPNTPQPQILELVKQANKTRLIKQPLDKPSCGSVFVNPPGQKAALLIDSSGLKGYSVGGAQVSLKHANFIVNTGGATADEIWKVICYVQSKVFEQFKIQLQTEVVRMGRW